MNMTFDQLIQGLIDLHNTSAVEFNAACDAVDALESTVTEQGIALERQNKLLSNQDSVIQKAVEAKKKDEAELKQLRAEVKALRALDPKRLDRINKEQKQRIAKLKAELEISEKQRKTSDKELREVRSHIRKTGQAPFYEDPKNKNTIRFTGSLIIENNILGAIPHTPVVEFTHGDRGITRQGFLTTDGDIAWCDARNSTPTITESEIAKAEILEYCKQHKVKTKVKPTKRKAA